MTNTPTTIKLRRDENGAYYVDTPEGRVEIVPDRDGGERITGWITCIDKSGHGPSMHRTLADVRKWIARGGR